jgi:general secretion pathway protein G
MKSQRGRHSSAGFSFVELMVSVAILATLAMVAMPLAEATRKRQQEHELRQALQTIRQAIDAYKQATQNGNIVIQPGQSGYPPSLLDLTAGVLDAKQQGNKQLYFLRSIPRDPFSTDATAAAIDTWGKRSYASPADNPREGDDVFDVYSRSSLTGLNGVPYAEW